MLALAVHLPAALVPHGPPREVALSRRSAVGAAGGVLAALSLPPVPVALAIRMSPEEMDARDLWSRTGEPKGVLLPSGVRVIDMEEGTGPLPAKGARVWCHFKAWTKNFRSGQPADSSFLNTRPYDWVLGSGGTARLPAGVDEGAVGMREGGWRRLVIPAKLAYGEQGLKFGKTDTYLVAPNQDVYFELNMVDGGSGKCVRTLQPEGVSEVGQRRLRSISCELGKP